ncbi:MAG: helix-turn-helix transcriptional regulator [Lachnospiraceae bacterium]|nr:helix-turn-helix transcriptional regulator [Lachnospiraceae bacterium]
MAIRVNIDVLLAMRKMPAGELAERIGITLPNLSILKNDKAKAIRFSTLNALCRELNCQPGDLITFVPDDENTDQKEEPESWNKI